MNKPERIRKRASLLERAAEAFDFTALMRRDDGDERPVAPMSTAASAASPGLERRDRRANDARDNPGKPVVYAQRQNVDRDALAEAGMIVPGGPVSGLAEEFRIVKRRLLREIKGLEEAGKGARARRVLIASANPHEGKTYCAVNLAMSLAMEQDHEVLLVDADFAKPSILSALGLSAGRGFMDALADPALDVANAIIPTDISGLAVLPAGEADQPRQRISRLRPNRSGAPAADRTGAEPHRDLRFAPRARRLARARACQPCRPGADGRARRRDEGKRAQGRDRVARRVRRHPTAAQRGEVHPRRTAVRHLLRLWRVT